MEVLSGLQSLIRSVGGLHEDGIIVAVCACKPHNLTFFFFSTFCAYMAVCVCVCVYPIVIGAQVGTECVILS